MTKANYNIARDTPHFIIIKDLGPWDEYPTVTNDIEEVVLELVEQLDGRRLYCIDSEGEQDEIIIKNGEFSKFKFGGPDDVGDT